jgi:hypothetical protein
MNGCRPSFFLAYLLYGFLRPWLSREWRRERAKINNRFHALPGKAVSFDLDD